MLHAQRPTRLILPAIQILAALGGVAALALYAPGRQAALLVPISADAGRGMIARAVAGGARLTAGGPVAGSYVVSGSPGALLLTMLVRGVIVLPASPVQCGEEERR